MSEDTRPRPVHGKRTLRRLPPFGPTGTLQHSDYIQDLVRTTNQELTQAQQQHAAKEKKRRIALEEKAKTLHRSKSRAHAVRRAEERMGVHVDKEDIKVMSDLINAGMSVYVGKGRHLIRYGTRIFYVAYCTELRSIKTVFPDDEIAGIMISKIPKSQLHKLV